jgi:hypothetical protein
MNAAVPSMKKATRPRGWLGFWLRRLLFWGAVFLVPFLFWRWWSLSSEAAQGQKDLQHVRDEMATLDPRWRWEQLEDDQPSIPDERNSMPLILRLNNLLGDRDPQESTRPDNTSFPGERPTNCLLDDADLARLESATTAHAEAITLAVALRDYPRGHAPLALQPDVLRTLLPHLLPCRRAAWLLRLDAERHLDRSQAYAAAQDVHAILHAGAALRHQTMTMPQLMRLAIRDRAARCLERVLALSELDAATLADLQEHLVAEAVEQPTRIGLRGERASYNHFFECLRSGELSLATFLENAADSGQRAPGYWLQFSSWVYGYCLDSDHAYCLQWLNRAVAIADLPPEDQGPQWAQWESDFRAARLAVGPSGRRILTFLFAPPLVRFGEAAVRDRALLASTWTAVAAERFRREHGRWPEALAELVPTYLAAVPRDPYSDDSLLYRRFADGVAIYSVGKDGKDDGGIRLEPPSRWWAGQPSNDLGIRLWDPPYRRLPPRPPEDVPEPEPVPLREVAP